MLHCDNHYFEKLTPEVFLVSVATGLRLCLSRGTVPTTERLDGRTVVTKLKNTKGGVERAKDVKGWKGEESSAEY